MNLAITIWKNYYLRANVIVMGNSWHAFYVTVIKSKPTIIITF